MKKALRTSLLLANLFVVAGLIVATGLTLHTVYELYEFLKKEPYRYPLGDLAGFADKDSYEVGDEIHLFVHTTAAASGRLFRYAEVAKDTQFEIEIPPTVQSDMYDPTNGFEWRESGEIETTDLRPGLYGLHLQQIGGPNAEFIIPLIIKPKDPVEIEKLVARMQNSSSP
jgi:hypothetical protein